MNSATVFSAQSSIHSSRFSLAFISPSKTLSHSACSSTTARRTKECRPKTLSGLPQLWGCPKIKELSSTFLRFRKTGAQRPLHTVCLPIKSLETMCHTIRARPIYVCSKDFDFEMRGSVKVGFPWVSSCVLKTTKSPLYHKTLGLG